MIFLITDSERLKHLSATDADLGIPWSLKAFNALNILLITLAKRLLSLIIVIDIDIEVYANRNVATLTQARILTHPCLQILIVWALCVFIHELNLVLDRKTLIVRLKILLIHHHLKRISIWMLPESLLQLL